MSSSSEQGPDSSLLNPAIQYCGGAGTMRTLGVIMVYHFDNIQIQYSEWTFGMLKKTSSVNSSVYKVYSSVYKDYSARLWMAFAHDLSLLCQARFGTFGMLLKRSVDSFVYKVYSARFWMAFAHDLSLLCQARCGTIILILPLIRLKGSERHQLLLKIKASSHILYYY